MKVKLRIEIEDPEEVSMDLAASVNDAEDPLDGNLGELIALLVLGVKSKLCSPEETLANALHVIYVYAEDGELSEGAIAFLESAKTYLTGLAKLRGRGA
jgi:hypothetical protein